jgi:hypothetical protein
MPEQQSRNVRECSLARSGAPGRFGLYRGAVAPLMAIPLSGLARGWCARSLWREPRHRGALFASITLVLGFVALRENWTFVSILWALVPGFGLIAVPSAGGPEPIATSVGIS